MQIRIKNKKCPLCGANNIESACKDRYRDYLRCLKCQLVFVPSEQFISAKEEKAEYDLHQNSPHDPGYRRFLGRLFKPMQEELAPGSEGLDFGSGPGPTLSVMFEETGFPMDIYDPFYANDPLVLTKQYDFITATEVVEHLFQPREVLDQLWAILKPGGLLGIMTKLVIDMEAFKNWHYKNDLTHVCFFSKPTFEWLADMWHAKVTFIGKDVILLSKNG